MFFFSEQVVSLKRAMWRICLAFLCLAQVSSLNLEQLRPSLWSLAEVLQDLTGDEHSARKTLEEKAGKMEDDGTAGLLRQLARQGRNDAKVFSSSSVSESHVDGQGHGYVLRHVKTCKNGVCEEHTEKTSPKKGNEGNEMSLKMPDQKKNVEFSDALDREIGKLQEHMRNMERHIKVPDFDIFAPVSEDFWNHFHSIPESSNQTESLSHSEFMSEETVMRNGHAVRRLRRCKNGKCHTTVEEGNSTKTATSVLDLDLP